MPREISEIQKDIDFFMNAKQVNKVRYYVRELRHAVETDEEAVALLNSGAVSSAYANSEAGDTLK